MPQLVTPPRSGWQIIADGGIGCKTLTFKLGYGFIFDNLVAAIRLG